MDSSKVCWKFEIFPPQGTGFAHGEKFCEEHRGTFVPCVDSSLVLVKTSFCLPRKGEWKQTEPNASWCDIFDDDGVAQLKKVLQVSTCVLAWQTTELVCLYHRNQANPELKVFGARVDSGPNGGGVVKE
jgi:hypothetical protein